jgi:S1-C subfamily serine protease
MTEWGSVGGPRPRRARHKSHLGTALVAIAIGLVIGHYVWTGSVRRLLLPPTFGPGRFQIVPANPAPNNGRSSSAPGAPGNVAAIAREVDASLVDINTVLSYEGAGGAGTGIVLTQTGEILTNNHVVEGATSISVTDVANHQTYAARVLGYDRAHDVAVIQLKSATDLDVAKIGSSSAVKVGDGVVAVGNARGLGGTPSYAGGAVVGLNQSITAQDAANGSAEELHGLLETNAAIEPGDSGGALVNASGRVVGIVTAGSEGFRFQQTAAQGFAIPIDEALGIASQIKSGQASSTVHVGATAFLGVDVQTPTTGSGARIVQVVPGGPAATAGLSAGETILSVGGRTVTSPESLTMIVLQSKPGKTVQVRVADLSGTAHSVTLVFASGPPQ